MKPTAPRPLRGLLVSQFFGAFNDNSWKMIVTFLAIRGATAHLPPGDPGFELLSQHQTTLTFVVFTLPLTLFSLPAGVLSDRFSKRRVIVVTKLFEFALLIAATLSLYLSASTVPLLVILGLMGLQAAIFSPAKYGILPELLPTEDLSWGNGRLEMWSNMAIIGGTGLGALILDLSGASTWLAGLLLAVFSFVGCTAAFTIPDVPPARDSGGIDVSIVGAWSAVRQDRVLWLSVLGGLFYWTIASLLGQDILVYTRNLTSTWGNADTFASLPLAVFGLGIGLGSLLAGRISGRRVEYGLMPLGAIGIAFFTILMGIWGPGYVGVMLTMALLGICSGFVVVPLNAILQWRSPDACRGGVIALSNAFTFAGIMLGSLAAGGLATMGLSGLQILWISGLLTIAATLWAIHLLPDFLIRLVFVFLTHTFYRLSVVGHDNIPVEGGALIVPNHVSFIDSFFVMASTDRPVRFIVEEKYYDHLLLHPLMKAMQAIPVSATGGLRVVLRALREAGNCLDEGYLVCIFPEGELTRTGMMLPFRRGLERIVKGRTASVIPAHLDRVWGSIYSRSEGRYLFKMPKGFRIPITVSYGQAVPAATPAWKIRRLVVELSRQAWEERKPEALPLNRRFIQMMRYRRWQTCFRDATRPNMTRAGVLAATVALARTLRQPWAGQSFVGILMPPTIGGALANLAAVVMGKTGVNLNFTAGAAGMGSAARQAGLKTVLTSRQFLERAKVEIPEGLEVLYMEDVSAGIGSGARLTALIGSLLLPIPLLERFCGAEESLASVDRPVTVIFSSGSTGDPKGVVLSHYNVLANVEGVGQVFGVSNADSLLGILPLFHSFGFMSLWFSILHGMSIVFHPNPLDAAGIGALCEQHRITFLIATPTFLQIYLRRVTPGQFGSLRIVFTGAEKLSDRLSLAFEEKFGIRPIEGYGATECAPAISVSTLDYRGQGIFQAGSRRGFVGHPVPGVAVRVVDPDTFEHLPPYTPGMLLVQGPNVMLGYLGRDDLTAKAMKDGWYITGDIAMIDETGFLKITDRLSRFSKIGGEMVPHGKVEEALHQAHGSNVQVFAVTAVPDEKKGEALVVLHTIPEEDIPDVVENMAQSGLPNLFIPKKDRFLRIDKIPVLGTGKIDLRGVKAKAMEVFAKA